MLTRHILMFAACVLLSSGASAKAVFLSCVRSNGEGGPVREAITLNENTDSGRVALPETGYSSGKLPADFGQNDVILRDDNDIVHSEYVINRKNLKYTLIRSIGDHQPNAYDGKCKIGRPTPRKF